MSYSRVKSANFGSSRSGLATVAYSLDGGSNWSTAGVSEVAAGTGIYRATVTFPDGFTGTLLWKTGEASGQRFAAEEINPDTEEIATKVWASGSRTVTAFPFSVTVAGFTGGPSFRNQDGLSSPTWEDCLASAWAYANAAETESDQALTFIRKLPNGNPMRTFVLTADANGNPIGRH